MTTKRLSTTETMASDPPEFVQIRPELHYEQIKIHLDEGGYRYHLDLAASIQHAREYIERRIGERQPNEIYAIVLDIDETAISNWEYFKAEWPEFTFEGFNRWVASSKACSIEPTLELFEYVKSHGVDVFFISSRPEEDRTRTEQLLEKTGYRGWKELKMLPHLNSGNRPNSGNQRDDTTCYKSGERRKIIEAGYLIIANIGDQQSDLTGGYAERHFKLPNPFYSNP